MDNTGSHWLMACTLAGFDSCFFCVHSAQSGVMWRKAEEAVKIQCQCSVKGVRSFVLFKDLNEEVKVVNRHMESRKNTIALTFKDRLKITADNSSVDIEIKNLTVDDTGVYMCMFKRLNPKNDLEQVKGNGSVLLVVTGESNQYESII